MSISHIQRDATLPTYPKYIVTIKAERDLHANVKSKQKRQKKITSPAGFEPARENPLDFKSNALTARP